MGQDDLKPEGVGRQIRLGGEAYEDDVEGHVGTRKPAAAEPDGIGTRKPAASDDDDVEGHRLHV